MNYGGGLSGSCRASREAREFYELKQRAAEFYRANGVPQRLEEALNLVFLQRPEDVYGSLANYFSQFAKTPVLCRMTGRSILDGRGWPVLEVEIFCTVKNNEKSICSSVISSHSELAELALTSVTEAQEKEIRASVEKAKEWINETLNTLLSGLLPSEQLKIDRLLSEYFTKEADEEKERARIEKEERGATEEAPTPVPPPAPVAAPPSGKKKESAKGKKPAPVEKPIPPAEPSEPVLPGSPAIGGVSLAIAKAAAVLNRTPLYMHIASLRYEQLLPKKLIMPLPLISLLSCGKSSPGKLNLMKEVLVLPRSNLTIRQTVDMCLALHKEISNLIDSTSKTGDAEQWSNLVTVLGSKFNLIAEAASQSVSRLLENRGANTPPSTGVVIRHINQTTVTDLLEIIQLLDERKDMVVLGSTDGESSDDGLVDLAVGLGASFIKLGGLFRGERASKYNRLVTIEEELARSGTLGVRRDTQALHEETPTPATLEAISVKSEDEEKEKEVVVLNTQPLEQD
ncbi:enolase 4 isoform X3 [Ambystoma mexicanum]|uniref:enolase 4 isoform X3 n=1 Tax=Ambystoma mexicanum TaxID=8296 RepID=UPI0037E7C193